VDEGEVRCDFFDGWRLEKDMLFWTFCYGLRVGIGSFRQGFRGNDCGSQGSGGIEILKKGSAEGDDWDCRVGWNSGK